MNDLLNAQQQLTKDLPNIEANEVAQLLATINEIRMDENLRDFTSRMMYIAAFVHNVAEEEELNKKMKKCVSNDAMSEFFIKQIAFSKILR